MKLAAFKAVFFDAGGTLLHPFPSVGEIYRDVALRYHCRVGAETLQRLFQDAWLRRDGLSDLVSHADEKIEKKWWHSLVREIFDQVGGVPDFEDFFEDLYEIFGRPEVWRLYPGTLEVLKQLKSQKKCMGVISNWDRRLFQLCDGLDLRRYFDFILASAVFGAAKPSPKIFEEALERAGVLPHQAVHIGDSLEDDIRGARSAGLEAVLVNRHPERLEIHKTQLQNVTVIHDLSELI